MAVPVTAVLRIRSETLHDPPGFVQLIWLHVRQRVNKNLAFTKPDWLFSPCTAVCYARRRKWNQFHWRDLLDRSHCARPWVHHRAWLSLPIPVGSPAPHFSPTGLLQTQASTSARGRHSLPHWGCSRARQQPWLLPSWAHSWAHVLSLPWPCPALSVGMCLVPGLEMLRSGRGSRRGWAAWTCTELHCSPQADPSPVKIWLLDLMCSRLGKLLYMSLCMPTDTPDNLCSSPSYL